MANSYVSIGLTSRRVTLAYSYGGLDHPLGTLATMEIEQEDVDGMWRDLKQTLVQELDGSPDLFNRAVLMSRNCLGPNQAHISDAQRLLDTLENNMNDRDELSEFLVSLTDYLKIHSNMGACKFSDKIQNFKQKVADIDERTSKYRIWSRDRDENFTGRTQDIDKLLRIIKGEENLVGGVDVRAVTICGLGGMGKTTVAKEVCYRLRGARAWKVRRLDLREKESIVDFLRDGLTVFGVTSPGEDTQILYEQLTERAKSVQQKMVLLIDNIDDILRADRCNFIAVLQELITEINSVPDNKLKLIITVREKMNFPEDPELLEVQQLSHRLSGLLAEYELQKLGKPESIKLLKKCTNSTEMSREQCEEMVELCGYTPLAIVTVAKTIQFGFVSPSEIIQDLQPGTEGTSEFIRMKNCLDHTFHNMDTSLRAKFFCLQVFLAAPFNIKAARSVITPDDGKESTIILLLSLKSRHLVEIDDLSCLDDKPETKIDLSKKQRNIVYSLHPLVSQYLLELEVDEFASTFQDAQKRFVSHFMHVINKVYKEQESNCMRGVRLLNDNRTHIMNIYEILLSEKAPERGLVLSKVLSGEKKFANLFLSCKNLSFMAADLITVSKQLLLCERLAAREKEVGNIALYIFWLTKQMEQNVRQQRTERAENLLSEIESHLPHLQKEAISIPVQAEYCYVKGLWHKLGDTMECFEKCLSCMLRSKELYEECQPVNSYRSTMARIINSIGCTYYKMRDLGKAREHHQQAVDIIRKMAVDGLHLDISTYEANLASVLHREGLGCENKEQSRLKLKDALNHYSDCIEKDQLLNLHKLNSHAQKRKNRADVYMNLEKFDEAYRDAQHSITMRRSILIPTHTDIALGTHKVAQILYRRGCKELSEGKKENGKNSLEEAKMYYRETVDLIKYGGLPPTHEEYPAIREEFRGVLEQLGEVDRQWPKIEKFFEDFEKGLYADDNQRLSRQINRMLHQKARDRPIGAEMSESDDEVSSSDMEIDEDGAPFLDSPSVSITDDGERMSPSLSESELEVKKLRLSPAQTNVTSEQQRALKHSLDPSGSDLSEEPAFKKKKE
ncbi:hypothetical protein ScPMuIL_013029 [Solemya velum]